jgi:heme exporter protein B
MCSDMTKLYRIVLGLRMLPRVRIHAESSQARAIPGFFRQALLVIQKDAQAEVQSYEVTTTSAFFAVLVVVLASMSFHGGPLAGRAVMSGVVWLSVVFATVLSLGRSWAKEREGRALAGLLSSPLRPGALFLGKTIALFLFLLAIELIVFPLAALFFSVNLLSAGPGLALLALLASPGIAAAGTLFGSMSVRTSARDLAIAVVLLPLLSPVVLTAVAATRALLDGANFNQLLAYLRLLFVYDLAFFAGGLGLFGALIED